MVFRRLMVAVASMAMLAAQGSAPSADNEHSDSKSRPTVGLVLSGGGAKGVAHIGVIRALEENGIPIDYITGTSMGAIVGGLYAAGYTPDEMMELLASKEFFNASTGYLSPEQKYQFLASAPSPAIINVSANLGNGLEMNSLLPTSLISPTPMNFTFMEIFAPYTGQCQGNFNNLFVPFRCVASDITNRRPIVFRSGQLGKAVRASMSFPIVFKPVVAESMMLYDGGIYDNFPVNVMIDDFEPDFILGVDVHSTDTIKEFPDIMSQMEMLVMQPNSYVVPSENGMKLRINLDRFSLLDFAKSDEIEQIGYRHALAAMDSLKLRTPSRVDPATVAERRRQFKASTPPIVFDSVRVTGRGSDSEKEYIASLFKPEHADTFGIEFAAEAYGKALSTGRLKDLDPEARYNRRTGHFELVADVTTKGNLNFGFGGYLTSSANSMLYVSGEYKPLTFNALNAKVGAWIGQNYWAGQARGQWMLRSRRQLSLALDLVGWGEHFNESDKLFYKSETAAFIHESEYFARLVVSRPTGYHSWFDTGIGYGYRNDKFYNSDVVYADATRNITRRNLGQVMFRWQYNTLNSLWLPTSGRQIKAMVQGVSGHYHFTPGSSRERVAVPSQSGATNYLQFEALYRDFYPAGDHWVLGVESNLLYSTVKLLDSYTASLVNAQAFRPTASAYNTFNPDLRANSYVTAGFVPVFKFSDRVSARGSFHAFIPMRSIVRAEDGTARNSRWFSRAAFLGETALVVDFPFASLSVYGNYQTSPGDRWGVGISFGMFILAPRMLRP